MIKPDYITFSQEVFNDCENLRAQLKADPGYKYTSEFADRAIELSTPIMSDEYSRFLREQQSLEQK